MSNKKITTLFILIATLALLGIIGFTIAYFTSSTDFENEFQTGLYQTTATETFESPQNWMPGDTTPKTLTITNTGNVDVKARVCITKDEWESANGTILPNEINGDRISIINLDNTDEWTKKGKCYEYNDVLEPNETTSSFIQSVTFNSLIEPDIVCTSSTVGNTTTKSCTSSGDGYDNATYTLTLRVETVQANKADEVWPANQTFYGSRHVGTIDSSTFRIGNELNINEDNQVYNTKEEAMEKWETDYDGYNRPIFFKYVLEYGIITEIYIGFEVSEEMEEDYPEMTAGTYYIRGAGATENPATNSLYNDDSIYYDSNKGIIQTAFGISNCDGNYGYSCSNNSLDFKINIYKYGEVGIEYNNAILDISANGIANLQWDD